MKYNLLLTLTLFGFTLLNAQEKITLKDGKQYPASPVFEFFCNDYIYDNLLEIQFAKTEKGGIMKLAIDVSNNQLFIGGRVYILLSNGSFIYCSDKGNREYQNNQSIAYYNLSLSEMSLIKKFNIEDIRFRIMGTTSKFSSDIGYFTATNKKQLFDPFDKSSNKIDTKSILTPLLL
ncbi:MAG: hypothetical protein ACI7YS_10340 [Flavobacterium sp.]